jgi:hypothetical protein
MISSPTRPEAGCQADRGEEGALPFPAEQVAIRYIEEQLEKARRSLRRTRTVCILIVLLILGYMSFVTVAIRNRLLRPEAAAEMAVYYFTRVAPQNGPVPSATSGVQSGGSVAPVSDSPVENPQRPFREMNPTANSDPLNVEAEVAA